MRQLPPTPDQNIQDPAERAQRWEDDCLFAGWHPEEAFTTLVEYLLMGAEEEGQEKEEDPPTLRRIRLVPRW